MNKGVGSLATRLAATAASVAFLAIVTVAQVSATGEREKYFDNARKMTSQGDLKSAASEYRKAIDAAGGDYPEAYNNLGMVFGMMGETKEAISAFKTALKQKEGSYAEAHYNLGIAFIGGGRFEEAIAEFKDSIEQSEGFPEAHYNLAVALTKLGRNEDAAEEFEYYLKLAANPSDREEVRTRITQLRKVSLR